MTEAASDVHPPSGGFKSGLNDITCLKLRTPRLQMRWASFALQHVRLKAGAGEAGRPLECSDAFLQEMSHFVSNLQQFVMDRLLHGAWLEQQQVNTTHNFVLNSMCPLAG